MIITFRGRLVEELSSICLQLKAVFSCHSALPYERTCSSYQRQVNSSGCRTYALPFKDCLVVLFYDWPRNRRPDGYRITDTAASCCSRRGSQAPDSYVWPPSVSTNSYRTRASYDSEFKSIYLVAVAGLLFGRRYLARNLYIPRCKQPLGLKSQSSIFLSRFL